MSVAATPTTATLPSSYGGMSSASPLSRVLSGLGADSVADTRSAASSSLGIPGFAGADASEADRSADRTGTAQTSTSGTAAEEGELGGADLGGAAGARREEDKEHHRSLPWLREDSAGVFDPEVPAVASVIDAPLDPDQDEANEAAPPPPLPRRLPPTAPAPVATPAPVAAPPLPAQPAPVKNDQAEPLVKMVWRLSENGDLEAVPAPEEPRSR